MRRVFLDTNVVIDLLDKREPFWKDVAALFTMAYNGQVELYISSLTHATVSYLLRKHGKEGTRALLGNLRELSKVTAVGETEVDLAMASAFDDYEDALQYFSAANAKVEAIVTRNKKDFQASGLPVMSPEEFVKSR